LARIRSRRDRDVDSFDRRARRYQRDWLAEFHTRVVAGSAEVALEVVPDPLAVLDVGCGTGALLRMLTRRLPDGVALVGVDPAPAMLQVGHAAALAERSPVWLVQAAAERLPFEDAGFDLVVSTVSFDHWADQSGGLAEVARVLHPGGQLVLVDLFGIGWLRPIAALGRRRDRMRTARELEAILADAGLRPLGRRRVFDLGPLPLVRAVVAIAGDDAAGLALSPSSHARWRKLAPVVRRWMRRRSRWVHR
jgi:SAM-dependent methyltransferase